MKRRTALLAAAALFAMGIVVGILGTHLFYLKRLEKPGLIVESATAFALRDLDHHLDLSPEQYTQVQAVLERAVDQGLRFRREVMLPALLEIVQGVRRDIEPILTPEQRGKLEALRDRYGGRLEKMIADEAPADR